MMRPLAHDEPHQQPDEAEDEEEPERQHEDEEEAADGRRRVPHAVQEHRAAVAADRRQPLEPRPVRLAGDAEADARHRRVERMSPRGEDAAHEERRRERAAGRIGLHRVRVVDDVLGGREPERREGGVDDAVHHAVELAPQEVEDAEDGEPLHALLDDGRRDARTGDLGEALAADGFGAHLHAGVDGARDAARGDGAPGEHQGEGPPRLGVVAIDEARDPDVDEEHRQGAERADAHREVLARRIVGGERHHEEEEDEGDEAREHQRRVDDRPDQAAASLGIGAAGEDHGSAGVRALG